MRIILSISMAIPVVCASCGASYPAPTQRMADAMSAERGAEEVGANTDPQGQLHSSSRRNRSPRPRA
jgi:hypothetical protein